MIRSSIMGTLGSRIVMTSGSTRRRSERFDSMILNYMRRRLQRKAGEDEDIPEDSFEEMERQEVQSRLIGRTID